MPYDDVAPPPETLPEDLSDPNEEFLCPDTELRQRYLDGYLTQSLSEIEQREFEDHLQLCFKCREDVDYFHWTMRQLRTFQRIHMESVLPVDALYDFADTDLLPYYAERPLTDQLAAASVRVGRVGFPITVEYLEGQVIGQFQRRVGHVFFHLKRSTIGAKKVACTLIYMDDRETGKDRKFEFQEGEEKRLGPFGDFAASDTLQDVVQALKRFQLVVKQQE